MRSLQESINEFGIINPLVVKRISKNRYQLVDGLSRFGCVNSKEVPCIVIGEKGTIVISKSQITIPKHRKRNLNTGHWE
jgi:hypothetical protein